MIALMEIAPNRRLTATNPNEREIEVKVTLADIWLGRPGQPQWCPVARAINRALGIGKDYHVNVSHEEVYIGRLPHSCFIRLPFKVQKFIRDFDCNGRWWPWHWPFRFNLTVPRVLTFSKRQ